MTLSRKAQETRHMAATELLARRGARKSLIEYCQFTLPRFQTNWHLEFLARELEMVMWGKTKRLMVFMPPRHGKSETISVRFPGFYLGNKPQNQVIATSYSGQLAFSFSSAIRQTMQGESYQRLWPLKFDSDSNVSWRLSGKENGRPSYIAAGVGGPISGQGADLLIIDDPVKNAEEADSFVIREKTWEWYCTTARTRLQPNGSIVIVQTRWHEDDLSGRLLRQMKADKEADQWKVVLLPAINEDGLGCIPDAIGPYEALWPGMYPMSELLKLRATVGSRTWQALFQQRPTGATGKIWKREWFRFVSRANVPNFFDEVVWSWDMSFKDNKDSDFVVGQQWGRIGSKKYLLRQVRERMNFTQTCAKVKECNLLAPRAHKILVEDKANGPAIIASLKETNPGITLIPIPKTGSKEACWNAATPDWEAGDVIFLDPKEEPWVNDTIDELCGVPEGALHDDQADAAAQVINYWRSRYRSSVGELIL